MRKRVAVVGGFVLLGALVLFLQQSVWPSSVTASPFDVDAAPEMVHIALTDDPAKVSVVWGSAFYIDWEVLYGHVGKTPDKRAVPVTATLTVNNDYGTTFWYRALLTHLVPGSEYSYTIVSRKKGNNRRTFSFHTLQVDSSRRTRLMIYGDLSLASRIIRGVTREGVNGYDAVFHVGDIGYALDGDSGGLVGDTFLWRMEPLTARVPYMVVPGDYETSARFAHFRLRFSVPGVPWPMPVDRTWYSVNIGMLHVVAVNTEVYSYVRPEIVDAQLAWLERDLQRANDNRSHVPWLIVLGHRPFYTFSRQASLARGLAVMETLFQRYRVDLVVQSHAHMYERTWPVYRGRSDDTYSERKAPVYVTVGSPGYKYGSEKLEGRLPDWSAAVYADANAESFGRLTVLGRHRLVWQQVSPFVGDYPLDEFMLE